MLQRLERQQMRQQLEQRQRQQLGRLVLAQQLVQPRERQQQVLLLFCRKRTGR